MSVAVLRVRAEELAGWAARLRGARAPLRRETAGATDRLAAEGVEIARGLVRVETGRLQGSIAAEAATFAGEVATGSYAPDTEYAAIHEFGGVIEPKRGSALRFTGRDGRPVFVRRVVISAQPYIRPSARALRGRVGSVYAAAVRRAIEGLGW